MKKGILVALAGISIAMASASQNCEKAIEGLIKGNMPPQLQVEAKVDSNYLQGGKELGNGWAAYVVNLAILQNGQKVSSDSLIAFCNDKDGLASLDLVDYNGTNYRAQIQKSMVAQVLEKYKDRIVVKGNSGKTYILFTDPLCPFCQKFSANAVQAAMDNNDTLYIFSVALPMHPDAPEFEKYIEYGLASAKDSDKGKIFVEFYKLFNGKHSAKEIDMKAVEKLYKKYGIDMPKNLIDDGKSLQENRKVMALVGARGTPMLFDQNGKEVDIVGYIDDAKVKALAKKSLEQPQPKERIDGNTTNVSVE